MNKIMKMFVLMLIVAFVSLGLTSCNNNGEHPSSEHPSKKVTSKEHPSGEHPAKETSDKKRTTGDHPK